MVKETKKENKGSGEEEVKPKKVGRKVLHEYPEFWNQCERCKHVVSPPQIFRWDAKVRRQDPDKQRHPEHSKWDAKQICSQCLGTLKAGAKNGMPKIYGGY